MRPRGLVARTPRTNTADVRFWAFGLVLVGAVCALCAVALAVVWTNARPSSASAPAAAMTAATARWLNSVLPFGRADYRVGLWPQTFPFYSWRMFGLGSNQGRDPALDDVALAGFRLFLIHLATTGTVLFFAIAVRRPWQLRSRPDVGWRPRRPALFLHETVQGAIISWPVPILAAWLWQVQIEMGRAQREVFTRSLEGSGPRAPVEFGLALGPAGYWGVVAGALLAYVFVMHRLLRAVTRRAARIEGPGGKFCWNCGYPQPLSKGAASCPECGGTRIVTFAEVRRASRLRRRVSAMLVSGLALILLFTPVVLGWIGRLLPSGIWSRYMPY